MKIYKGKRRGFSVSVVVEESSKVSYSLPLRTDIVNHSPDGYQWGYGGSGPAQLAFDILMDLSNNKDLSLKAYQAFKRDVISSIKEDDFTLSAGAVDGWARAFLMNKVVSNG